MLGQGFGRLQLKTFGDIAIVLDASESAWEYRDVILRAATQLFEKLPAGVVKELYFLSNPKHYDANRLQRNAAKWWEQNRLRGSFLTPILEQVANSRVVVIGSGRLYDLDDWQETNWNSGLYFMKIGESLRGQLEIGEEVEELSQLLSCLYDTIISVEISGDGFMPYYWSNPEYKLLITEKFTLAGSNLENPSVSVGFFGTDVKARVIRKSSDEFKFLEPAEDQAEEVWKPLTQEECLVFRKALKGQEFTCPICGKQHLVSGLRCDHNSILGEPIYPSLAKKKGFVFFKETSNGVFYRSHPVNVVKIGSAAVAVALGNRAMIYEYDVTERQWMEKDYIKPYYAFKDTYMAVI
jgi:hypothetical protein